MGIIQNMMFASALTKGAKQISDEANRQSSQANNKRALQKKQSWINNVKKVYGWDDERANKEFEKIFGR